MSILFMDGFSHYGTASLQALQKWDSADPTHVITTGGRYSASALSASGSQGTTGTKKTITGGIPYSNDEGLVGYNSYYPAIGASASDTYFRHLQILEDAAPVLTFVILDSTHGADAGKMRVVRGDHDGTTLGTTSEAAVEAAAHHHLEVRWAISSTVGEVEVRKDGALILLLTGVNTAGASSWNVVSLLPNVDEKISHFYVIGTIGDDPTYFLGADAQIQQVFPTSDDTGQWTPSTGANHYATVDENPATDDADYNYARSAPKTDLFNLADVTIGATTVYAVMWTMLLRQVSAAYTPLVGTRADTAGGILFGHNNTPTTAYLYYSKIWHTYDGPGGSPWTQAIINAAQFGLKRSA